MVQPRKTRRTVAHHPIFARAYARWGPVADARAGIGPLRGELLAGLAGRVIEIGAGGGLNFAHYPGTVSEVVAIEPEAALRQAARTAAARTDVPVDVVPGVAEALPVKSEAFDAAVVTLVLCSVGDVPRALAELRRVLRPEAELRFFEHVRAEGRGLRAVQWAADRTVWPLLNGGCRTGRDTTAALAAAGFAVERQRQLRVPPRGITLPSSPVVMGTARRPGTTG